MQIDEPNIFPTPIVNCPDCGKKLDTSSCIEKEVESPKFGDLSVCFGCGCLMQFDEKLKLNKAPNLEDLRLDKETEVALVRMIKIVKDKNNYLS